MAAPNQYKVVKIEEIPRDNEHPYARISVDGMRDAMAAGLNEYEFKLYMILAMNKMDYSWELSPEFLTQNYGGCAASWRRARDGLIAKKYLVNKGNLTLEFHEVPARKNNIAIYDF